MKKLVVLSLIIVLSSCAKKAENPEPQPVKKEIKTEPLVGADEDLHGCKSSAGYTWSVLKNKCVRIFKEGTRLDSNQKNTMGAFVIFDDSHNKAEVFTMLEKKPIILVRKAEGQPWVNADWQLIVWKGYVLKKGKAILFTGK